MYTLLRDVRLAARQLVKVPGFSLVALLTLGLGIGATTLFFSLLNTFVFRPLPYDGAERIVVVTGVQRGEGGGGTALSYADLTDLGASTRAFEAAAVYRAGAVNLGGATEPTRLTAARTSIGFFAVFGATPALGRGFLPSEARVGGERVVVLGHAAWTKSFGADPRVLGRTVLVDGEPHTIVGVAPARFDFPAGTALWTPLAATSDRADRSLDAVARVRQGTSVDAARTAVETAAARLAAAFPETNARWSARLTPLREVVGQKMRGASTVLLVASCLVLLIACGNLGNLYLVLVSSRLPEVALRTALGATRGRVVRQFVTEGIVLAAAGGVLGTLLARWGLTALVAVLHAPAEAGWLEFGIDYRVLAFAFAVSAATGIATSLSAALRGSRADLRATLQQGARGAGPDRRGRIVRRGAIVAQIALALPLVVGATGLVLSAMRLDRIDPGFDAEGIVTARVSLSGRGYDAAESRVALVDAALGRLAAMPGVRAATATSHAPLIDRNDVPWVRVLRDGDDPARPGLPAASVRHVVDGYHAAMRVPLSRGRAFTAAESRDARAAVVVINETMARRLFPNGDAVGARLELGTREAPDPVTIVGVAGDVMQRQLPAEPENQLYRPLARARDVTLVVRARDAAAAAAALRAAVAAVDPALPLYQVRTMGEAYAWYFRDRALQGGILGVLGLVAALLAALGVYGVMAFTVAQQTREIGIRMALGGGAGQVVRQVLGGGLALAGAGIALGLALAVVVSRVLASVFVSLRAFDPALLAGVAAAVAAVVAVAAYLPTRRATRVPPVVALRTD